MFDDLIRRDGVTDGFGHLHALLIEREPVGDHIAIGRTALGAAGLQERGMEPAAVLVGAFHVDIGDAILCAVLAVAQNERVGGAGIEPHIQHVKDLIIVIRVGDAVQDLFFKALLIPNIRAFFLKGGGDAGVQFIAFE